MRHALDSAAERAGQELAAQPPCAPRSSTRSPTATPRSANTRSRSNTTTIALHSPEAAAPISTSKRASALRRAEIIGNQGHLDEALSSTRGQAFALRRKRSRTNRTRLFIESRLAGSNATRGSPISRGKLPDASCDQQRQRVRRGRSTTRSTASTASRGAYSDLRRASTRPAPLFERLIKSYSALYRAGAFEDARRDQRACRRLSREQEFRGAEKLLARRCRSTSACSGPNIRSRTARSTISAAQSVSKAATRKRVPTTSAADAGLQTLRRGQLPAVVAESNLQPAAARRQDNSTKPTSTRASRLSTRTRRSAPTTRIAASCTTASPRY